MPPGRGGCVRTKHRAHNVSWHAVQRATAGRFSYPFFFDPSFDARMRSCTHLLRGGAVKAGAGSDWAAAEGWAEGRGLWSWLDCEIKGFGPIMSNS